MRPRGTRQAIRLEDVTSGALARDGVGGDDGPQVVRALQRGLADRVQDPDAAVAAPPDSANG